MSGNADTIKDFLVSLGFDIDQAGANKFEAVLKGVTANVLKVGAVVEGTALAIVGFTTQIANGLDKVYWASQRTGASVQGIKALGYAAAQTGASAESAMSSLEGLASFMRSNPGAEGFLNRLGVQTRDASGKMRDTASIFTGVGQKLNNMPYYRAKQYAQMLGIDENTLMAMRRGMNGFTADYQSMLQKTGFNADKAAVQSNKFMTSMRGLTSLFGIMRDKIGSNLAGGLAGSLDGLRKRILDNWPKIEVVLMKVIKGILWAGDAVSRVLWRTGQAVDDVMTWFKKLDPVTQQLIKLFFGLLVAWRLLNTAFLTSPIGIVLALGAAIIALYDDYKTWKEGGKSLIDWGKWEPAINYALKAMGVIRDSLLDLWESVKGLAKSLSGLWKSLSPLIKEFGKLIGLDFSKFSAKSVFDSLIKSIKDSIAVLTNLVDAMKLVMDGDFSGAFTSLKKAAGIVMDEAKDSISGGVYSTLNNKLNQYLPAWLGGAPSKQEPDQYAQSVKRPQASSKGKVLLDWMGPMFTQLESLYKLPEGLLKSVAITESGGNQFAQSGAGAKGLFQFMDGTAKDMGLRGSDVFDPEKSAQAAAKYLSSLLKQNGGDLNKALASYNWGIGNVQRHGMGLMPQETRNYIPKVRSNMPSARAPIQQETNIHIHGVSDPREAARLTVDRQKGVNSQLTQQLPAVPS